MSPARHPLFPTSRAAELLGRRARGALEEALAARRAARIDALAAPVGERGGAVAAEQRGKPAGQVAADHIAVARMGGPARDELREDRDRKSTRLNSSH